MCSISGSFSPFHNSINKEFLKQIIITAEDRGRDSFGIAYPKEGIVDRFISQPSKTPFEIRDSFVIINNNRAEPTTEYVKNKQLTDCQPFFSNETFIVHNGTIANDKELEKEFALGGKRTTSIDSEIIALTLNQIWDGVDENELIRILKEKVIGSFALALVDTRDPEEVLWLAVNYKPLTLIFDQKDKIYYFTSLENYVKMTMDHYMSSSLKFIDLKPYTLLKISKNGIKEFSLYPEDSKKKKALVIASSGLDSTVCATWSIAQGFETELLHFNYGCKAGSIEDKRIRMIAERLGVNLTIMPISFFKQHISHSTLFEEGDDAINTEEDGRKGAELAIEWVPARNLIFMSIAAGYAEAHKFDYIILGGNLEESGNFSDNEYIFQKKFNDILPNALNLNNKIEVLSPVGNLMKHEIVKLGVELGAPLDITWSCYKNNEEKPCGSCGPDFLRRMGFKMNGWIDPQAEDIHSPFWEGCSLPPPVTTIV
jgi:7-cyano-7-deazaguanine synthase